MKHLKIEMNYDGYRNEFCKMRHAIVEVKYVMIWVPRFLYGSGLKSV